MKGSKFDRELLVERVANMRIKGASTKTMLDFLQSPDIGYKQAEAYEIVRESQLLIKEIYKDINNTAFEEAIGRLERLAEDTNDKKLKLDIEKELNKLKGLYKPSKIDVTTDGKAITDINVIFLNGSEELDTN